MKSFRVFRLVFCFAILSCLAPPPGHACLNDRDTLVDESKGLELVPQLLPILAGKFERNPQLYYEMRINRIVTELSHNPYDDMLYDDIAVALDRLHRDKEALEWMDRKRARLEELNKFLIIPGAGGESDVNLNRDPVYRYFANIGTMRIHQWVRDGRDRERLAEVKQAREEIATSLTINPNAHYGREKFQLMAMDWIIGLYSQLNPKTVEELDPYPTLIEADPNLAAIVEQKDKASPKLAEAIEGLTGLIVLGDAWRSPDVFLALAQLLDAQGKELMAYYALLRVKELIDAGGTSIVPGSPAGDQLYSLMSKRFGWQRIAVKNKKSEFKRARFEADNWQDRRTDYMMERLQRGAHPDTEPAFWSDFAEAAPPGDLAWLAHRFGASRVNAPATIAALALITGAAMSWRWYRRAERTAAQEASRRAAERRAAMSGSPRVQTVAPISQPRAKGASGLERKKMQS